LGISSIQIQEKLKILKERRRRKIYDIPISLVVHRIQTLMSIMHHLVLRRKTQPLLGPPLNKWMFPYVSYLLQGQGWPLL